MFPLTSSTASTVCICMQHHKYMHIYIYMRRHLFLLTTEHMGCQDRSTHVQNCANIKAFFVSWVMSRLQHGKLFCKCCIDATLLCNAMHRAHSDFLFDVTITTRATDFTRVLSIWAGHPSGIHHRNHHQLQGFPGV